MKRLNVDKYTYIEKKYEDYIEELKQETAASRYLPKYHIYPPCGLLNDPNGLSYYNGSYHVFYQWHPFGPSHGMKHWAHVTSKDLIRWEWNEEMLIPDQEYEKNGCYSGNAVEKDGKLHLFYTANYKQGTKKIPKQALAVMDKEGKITKHPGNPIIDEVPPGLSGEIRDPFVFEKNGSYYMLLGGKDLSDHGQIIVYQSSDLINFKYKGLLDIGAGNLGTMLECPGYIRVDGKDVLFISVMGMEKQGLRFNNQFTSLYFIGELDIENLKFHTRHWDEIDCGFDFYAPQPFYGKDQVPLLIGWFGCGDQQLPTDRDMWRHGLTMPRRLKVINDRLHTELVPVLVDAFAGQNPGDQKYYHRSEQLLKAEARDQISIGSGDDSIKIRIDWDTFTLTMDRSDLINKIDPDYGFRRQCCVLPTDEIRLDIYVDNSFIEVYVNNDERVLSSRIFID